LVAGREALDGSRGFLSAEMEFSSILMSNINLEVSTKLQSLGVLDHHLDAFSDRAQCCLD
jgi:hypothetical protein